MDILGSLKQQLVGKAQELLSQHSPALANALTDVVQNHEGGLQGLVKSFQAKGLGPVVESWISQGQNLPVTPEQIKNALGNEKIQALAGKFGITPDQLGQQLAQHLPNLIDKLTPSGKLPA